MMDWSTQQFQGFPNSIRGGDESKSPVDSPPVYILRLQYTDESREVLVGPMYSHVEALRAREQSKTLDWVESSYIAYLHPSFPIPNRYVDDEDDWEQLEFDLPDSENQNSGNEFSGTDFPAVEFPAPIPGPEYAVEIGGRQT